MEQGIRRFKISAGQIAILLLSLVIMSAAAEGVLRAYFSLHQSYLVEMWRYGRHHKRFVADKRSHEHLPNTESFIQGHTVKIDRWGFRGSNRDPDPSKRQILVLGDSMTFGYGVGQEEAYPAVLEKKLGNAQVWNAGIGNYNTEQELASLPYHLSHIRFDEVILGFFINDLEPAQHGSTLSLLQSSLLFMLTRQVWWSYGDETRRDFRQYYQHWFNTGWDRWARVTDKGLAYLAEHGLRLKVLLIPELHTLNRPTFSGDYRRVADFFRSRNVPVCDGEQFFPETKTGGTEYWAASDDSHANAEAHQILAKGLIECFYQKK